MTVSETEAIDACKAEAARRGWTWIGQTRVKAWRPFVFWGRVSCYEIVSNANVKGCRGTFLVDADTGKVIEASFLPR